MKKIKLCKDCGKEIDIRSKRCKSCCNIIHGKTLIRIHCIDCDKLLSPLAYYYGYKRCGSCARKIIKGEDSSNFRHGECCKKHYCIDCHKEIADYKAKRCKKCSYLYKIKVGTMKGNQNGFFGKHHTKKIKSKISLVHGGTGIPYEFSNYPEEFYILRESIRNRDNHECQYCNIKEKALNRALDVHHIDYNKQNCTENNLISLCFKCHLKTNENRDYWYAYFIYLIENYILI